MPGWILLWLQCLAQDTKGIGTECTVEIEGTNFPILGSMYGIFTYIWLIFMVNVGKYTIHGSYGYTITALLQNPEGCSIILPETP